MVHFKKTGLRPARRASMPNDYGRVYRVKYSMAQPSIGHSVRLVAKGNIPGKRMFVCLTTDEVVYLGPDEVSLA